MLVTTWLGSKKFGCVYLDDERGCVSGKRYTKLKMLILLHDYVNSGGGGLERLKSEIDRYLDYLGYVKKDQV